MGYPGKPVRGILRNRTHSATLQHPCPDKSFTLIVGSEASISSQLSQLPVPVRLNINHSFFVILETCFMQLILSCARLNDFDELHVGNVYSSLHLFPLALCPLSTFLTSPALLEDLFRWRPSIDFQL